MKGIMFKEPLFNAAIEGRKIVTRRLIKDCTGTGQPRTLLDSTDKERSKHIGELYFDNEPDKFYKPRYKKGETVYLMEPYWDYDYMEARENVLIEAGLKPKEHAVMQFNSVINSVPLDMMYPYSHKEPGFFPSPVGYDDKNLIWKRSNKMFMPAKYARYHIGITDVRVERLQDISLQDALNEGVKVGPILNGARIQSPTIEAFAVLWNSVCKEHTWESNPFVEVDYFELTT